MLKLIYLYALDIFDSYVTINCFKGTGAENASGSNIYFEYDINGDSLYEGIHLPSTPGVVFSNHLYDHLIWFDHEAEEDAKKQLLDAYLKDYESAIKYHELQIKTLKRKIELCKESQK